MTRLFEFAFFLADEERELLEWSNALYDAGADDSHPGILNGAPRVAFSRQAETLEDAIRSAHRDVQAAGLQVVKCEMTVEQVVALDSQVA